MAKQVKGPQVRENLSEIAARASVSFPKEVENEMQAGILACGGATSMAQSAILDRVLRMKTSTGKPLYEAEVPYIEVQKQIRTMIKNAQVLHTGIRDKTCTVTIGISKTELRAILRKLK